jgi:phage shock protein A
MENVITEYQRWKQQGESLRIHARQAMEARFRDLLTEAAHISQEYQADFGSVLKPPPAITAFRFKAVAGKSPKKVVPSKTNVTKAVTAPTAPANAAIAPLEKKLAQTKAKLEAAKAAGKPTRNIEDRIYEIEDALRLARQPA